MFYSWMQSTDNVQELSHKDGIDKNEVFSMPEMQQKTANRIHE